VSGRNEAKLETLQDIIDLSELRPSEYSSMREISLHCASMRLYRCYRQGLLGRLKEGKEYVYYITDRGIDRLTWLSNKKIEESWKKIKRCPVVRSDHNEDEPYLKEETMIDDSTESWGEETDVPGDYLEHVERCRVEREENEAEPLLEKLSRERCRISE
jgi:hypothetical protein